MEMRRYIRFIPNILSISRLGIACYFPFSPEEIWIWLIIAGGCSDFFDGWVARRWQVATWQGGLLDGIADKAFILSVLITLVCAGRFPAWWIPAVIARDLTVACAAGYALYNRLWDSFRRMEARWSGKIATGGQFLFLILVVLLPSLPPMVLFLAVLFSLYAAYDYGSLFVRALRERAEQEIS
jgi:CDP-diacylglycerol--glycerol-3-phosphate 3-phosphatidyltransferase/cardiolipin synthase